MIFLKGYFIFYEVTIRGDQQIIDCYQIFIKNLVYSLLCSLRVTNKK